ncbi:MAG: two-component system, cell cycle response regulator [Thermoleophilaceae bacterium]|jgi:diguanylate cyclase (GGDEF)-like protein|nr:two-component system, cell cycle response regulator [Thermoleophilaceae bacterium]
MVAVGAIGVGLLLAAPWVGWWMLALFIPSGLHLMTVDRWIARSRSPELIPFFTMLVVLLLLAIAAAGTGGPDSPVLPWLALVPAMAALRFRLAVCLALAGVAALLIVAVGFAVDTAHALDDPVPMIAALVMLANIVGVCTALMRGELEHRDRAVLDPLTGLLNRASLESRVQEIEQQARLTDGPVALVLLDLDGFKRVNDDYGHERGDAVLRDAAYEIRQSLRSFELVYRIGGEEFLLLLPGADLEGGIEIAERVRCAVALGRPGELELTLSAGVATAAGHRVRYDDLFRAADGALLRAKREGRNRVVAADAPLAAAAA